MAWISNNLGFDEETNILYQRVSIHQLSPELSQVIIIGTVISKQDVRRIISKKQPGTERFVLNFTIRDSPNDTINAACWGEEAQVKNFSANFCIGDVVKIKNPQIIEKQTEFQDDRFRPPTNCCFTLNISPMYSEIAVCNGRENAEYKKLLHFPVHNSANLVSLADVVYNGQNAEGQSVNLLVAIRDIKPLQTVKLKTGREVKKMQLNVFDQTHNMFPITIWDEETAKFIMKYFSQRSILLISDLKIGFNAFMKELAGTAGSTTIFTPEPEIPDARVLYQYAMKTHIPKENSDTRSSDSSKIYKMNEICKIINASDPESYEMEGTVHAALTAFDIDREASITTFKCPECYQIFEKPTDKCTNGACEVGSGMKNMQPEEMYNLTVSLTDETGNLNHCLLAGQILENLLEVKAKDFRALSDEEKTTLKWNFLFEKFIIHFKISPSSAGSNRLHARVLEMKKLE